MTNIELTDRLYDLRWKQADLSRKLGVHQNTVSAWATAGAPVPEYVAEYLRVAMLAKDILK